VFFCDILYTIFMTALFSRSPLHHQVHNNVQLGFHPYGPTVTLSGQLSTTGKVCLIDHISISLRVPGSSIERHFEWFALHPYASSDGHLCTDQSPAKFVLSPGKPYPYSIMFADNDCYAEMKPLIQGLLSAWQDFRNANAAIPLAQSFAEFSKDSMIRGTTNILQDLCYWKPGKYALTVSVATNKESFHKQTSFRIEETSSFQDNIRLILTNSCGLPFQAYYTALAVLRE